MKSQGSDFEQVMLPHLDAAYNLARWLLRDPSIAEHVVQDAYARACKYFAAFRGGSARAWLLQIVRNAAYSTLKARRLGMEVSLSSGTRAADEDGVDMDMPDPSPGPEATLAQRQNPLKTKPHLFSRNESRKRNIPSIPTTGWLRTRKRTRPPIRKRSFASSGTVSFTSRRLRTRSWHACVFLAAN